jgi:hypothetical protein
VTNVEVCAEVGTVAFAYESVNVPPVGSVTFDTVIVCPLAAKEAPDGDDT